LKCVTRPAKKKKETYVKNRQIFFGSGWNEEIFLSSFFKKLG
jgi:hypothetical protein